MNFYIYVVGVAVIMGIIVSACLGAIAMAMFDLRRDDRAYQRGMAECPRIHEWGENTG